MALFIIFFALRDTKDFGTFIDITSLIPRKNDFEISCAEDDGAVGGTLEQTPNVAMRTATIAGILNRASCEIDKNMYDYNPMLYCHSYIDRLPLHYRALGQYKAY